MWAILPVKTLALSKQRLSSVLTDIQRHELAEAMLYDMLNVLSRHNAIDHVLIVSRDPDIQRIKQRYPMLEILLEPASCSGLNDAVALAVHHAEMHGAQRVLLLHADVPMLGQHDIDGLLTHHLQDSVTLIPDKHEQGTNGLLLDLPTEMDFCFGPGSFSRHLDTIRKKGLACTIADRADLSLDIDMPQDLRQLADKLARQPQRFTAQLLAQPGWQAVIRSLNTH